MSNYRNADWVAIQQDYDTGLSMRELYVKHGLYRRAFDYAKRDGLFIPRSRNEATKLGNSKFPRQFTQEQRDQLSEAAKARKLGGWRKGKQIEYQGVMLDSTYELRVAQSLDEHCIKWQRPNGFAWIDDDGKSHTYTPDFFLPDYGAYLDPKHKGLIPRHARKIELVEIQNNIKVHVLTVEQLDWNTIRDLIK